VNKYEYILFYLLLRTVPEKGSEILISKIFLLMHVIVTNVGQGYPMLLLVKGLCRAHQAAKYDVYL